ncbi:hypothetical protein [Pseudosporangium ferrugineum]|uniref:Uncharacterized protein n=1 Tax=Pseudosporangium ferrugineum TaxID=439699 RepID=A0A2T0RI63_9ACTN|nr:hypothetical protein [Pseudosporangium ferrugineum]PRY20817.1 hypothetical protein CLV70_12256 [Pseudosporangium ferrugineum]
MRHPTDGIVRRLVDDPAGVSQADREHVAGCPACLAGLAAAREDAALMTAALAWENPAITDAAPGTGAAPDVDRGWARLSQALDAGEHPGQASAGERPGRASVGERAAYPDRRRWRAALRSPVVAVAGVVALLAGAGAAAATDWLPIFRAEQITPVTAPEADLVKLPELSAFGRLDVTERVSVRRVSGPAAAEEAAGLTIPRVTELPRGVSGEPEYHVANRATAVFTYEAETAARTAAAAGESLPPPPARLDGSRFRLVAGPGVAAVWSAGRPVPAMVVGRLVAPKAYSEGIPFATARDYLLSLPILPPNVASQLRAFSGDGTTLPLFMSVEHLTSRQADVNGTPATVLASRDGVMAAVVWVNDGVVTAVAGSLSGDEVLTVARGLRWHR